MIIAVHFFGFGDDRFTNTIAQGCFKSVTFTDSSVQKLVGRKSSFLIVYCRQQLHIITIRHQSSETFMVGCDNDFLPTFDQLIQHYSKQRCRLITVCPQLYLIHPNKSIFVLKQMAKLYHSTCKCRNIIADALRIIDDRFETLKAPDVGFMRIDFHGNEIFSHRTRTQNRFEHHGFPPSIDPCYHQQITFKIDTDGFRLGNSGMRKLFQNNSAITARL